MDTVLGSIEKGCKRRKCMDTLIQDVVQCYTTDQRYENFYYFCVCVARLLVLVAWYLSD